MRVEAVTAKDTDAIIDMLKKSFFILEPLNSSIGLVPEGGSSPELEEYCRVVVPTGLSLCARDEHDGALEGVILNAILTPADIPAPETARVRDGDSKFDKIMAVNHAAEAAMNVFAAHPDVREALDVKILATDPDRGKKGVASELMKHTLDLARARGLRLVRCVCSGAYSARVVERLGFLKLGTLPYNEFLGPDGRPVFSPPAPHLAMTVWALRLS
ncbi:Dopamine N-acetyltransferase [Frankliniella fusca]|uniref:aralkylamine N-acetyltransferase n=1 Tax=Frankliniella fusca TaxID=407009 RepID=A0AAE1HW99_9NEOP|nr:Dopamine N-acetyltransferase [Frankliniella fusca]